MLKATFSDVKPHPQDEKKTLVTLDISGGLPTTYLIASEEMEKFNQEQEVDISYTGGMNFEIVQGQQKAAITMHHSINRPKLL